VPDRISNAVVRTGMSEPLSDAVGDRGAKEVAIVAKLDVASLLVVLVPLPPPPGEAVQGKGLPSEDRSRGLTRFSIFVDVRARAGVVCSDVVEVKDTTVSIVIGGEVVVIDAIVFAFVMAFASGTASVVIVVIVVVVVVVVVDVSVLAGEVVVFVEFVMAFASGTAAVVIVVIVVGVTEVVRFVVALVDSPIIVVIPGCG